MDGLLTKVKWPMALDYLETIVNFLLTAEEHTKHVLHVLTLLSETGVMLNQKI